MLQSRSPSKRDVWRINCGNGSQFLLSAVATRSDGTHRSGRWLVNPARKEITTARYAFTLNSDTDSDTRLMLALPITEGILPNITYHLLGIFLANARRAFRGGGDFLLPYGGQRIFMKTKFVQSHFTLFSTCFKVKPMAPPIRKLSPPSPPKNAPPRPHREVVPS